MRRHSWAGAVPCTSTARRASFRAAAPQRAAHTCLLQRAPRQGCGHTARQKRHEHHALAVQHGENASQRLTAFQKNSRTHHACFSPFSPGCFTKLRPSLLVKTPRHHVFCCAHRSPTSCGRQSGINDPSLWNTGQPGQAPAEGELLHEPAAGGSCTARRGAAQRPLSTAGFHF